MKKCRAVVEAHSQSPPATATELRGPDSASFSPTSENKQSAAQLKNSAPSPFFDELSSVSL